MTETCTIYICHSIAVNRHFFLYFQRFGGLDQTVIRCKNARCPARSNIVECQSISEIVARWEKQMNDYLVAHSMDARWFVIDAEGNIAIFDSDEKGKYK